MLKHVLMFRLKDFSDPKEKAAKLKQLQSLLECLQGKIPEIKKLKTGINISSSPASYDLFFDTTFKNAEALERYRGHPQHQEVVGWINENCSDRVVVDYWE